MRRTNYYLVLGVSPHESAAGIRAAYQGLARDPQQSETAFHEISEAYGLLSDPGRRLRYDRESESSAVAPAGPEPIPFRPASLFGQPENTRPSFQEFYDRLLRNFTGAHIPKAEHAESLTLDVVLTPLEAFAGCTIPVGVPLFRTCMECNGTGSVFPFRCAECGGSGKVEELREMQVKVPAGIKPGAILEAPLDLLGIQNLYLRVHVSISAQ
jgi:molecular chaperone DnaJ